ncbi:SusC/RagA family TonB-linked outer membrane protein [Lacihabitans soyangensis]|uniref:SusC/RagA family TonB-linked outer membrane protein n=1 Tax=Lacihabitans soyangensis TaxID=869394 RepID=A0AAE3KU67_9BACT|nr:SusC/RagA family TonB-linked outer membrane protein [Lacihabitans soyangensis]MCP9764574.1 SusC/RagA family TonB-linked outer membrane protein [Lacihabitans soyangensis]
MKKRLLFALLSFLIASSSLLAQSKTVSGTVNDSGGQGIPGVSVRVKNSNKGISTNGDGKFSLEVGSNAVLVFSAVGYTSKEVTVGNSSTINVELSEDAANLDEIVVSGLATNVKRSNLANAVSRLSSKDLTGTTTPVTTDGAIQGKLAGANIVANGSMPGGGFNMQFRGVSTLGSSASQPLFIVDGVYIDNSQNSNGRSQANKAVGGSAASAQDNNANRLADLNPDDIESIEVLKGASAAAIYGTRANAGVVIITTKRGKGGKTKVSFGQDLGVANAYAYYGGAAWTADKAKAINGDAGLAAFNAAAGKYTNWEKEIFGSTGQIKNSRLSLTGGNDKTSFYVNGSYSDETGIVKNTGFTRASFRTNLDHKLTSWLDLAVNANFVNSDNDRGWTGNDNSSINYGYNIPYTPSYLQLFPDANGNYPNSPVGENPLAIRDRALNNQKVNRFIGGVNLTARALNTENSSLTFKLSGGTDYQNGLAKIWLPSDLQSQKAEANPGYAQDTRAEVTNYNIQLAAVHTYAPTGSAFNFTTSAGIVQLGTNAASNFIRGRGLPAGVSNASRARAFEQDVDYRRNTDQGVFAQEEVNFGDKIIASAGVRFDRSTLNGDPNKWYAFPRASVASNFHKFGSWASDSPISQLKGRIAYGQTAGLPTWGILYSQLGVTGIGGQGGLTPSTVLGNTLIQPERATELEYGVDFGLFKNRVTAEVTFYNKKVFDLIQPLVTAPTTGVTSTNVNAADLTNKGVEITLGADVVKSSNLTWFVQPIYWFNRSEITRLTVPERLTGGFGATFGQWRIKEGLSPTQIVGQPRTDPANPTSWTVYGDQQPKFEFSLNQRITFFKNFEFSALAHYRHKFAVVSLARVLWDEGGNTSDWNETNQAGDGKTENGNYRQNVNGLDENGKPKPGYNPVVTSFLKLREASLYYRIPKSIIGKKLDGLKVGVSGNNLFRWTDYTAGYDPENSNFGSAALGSGVDIGSAPLVRRLMFHISVDL